MGVLGNVVGIGRLSGNHLCNALWLSRYRTSSLSDPGFDDPPELRVHRLVIPLGQRNLPGNLSGKPIKAYEVNKTSTAGSQSNCEDEQRLTVPISTNPR